MTADSNNAARVNVLVFGGTVEGRTLVEWLADRGSCDVVACSATEYGGSLLPHNPQVTSIVDRMDEQAMRAFMETRDFACVVDATHPYAIEVSANISAAAQSCGLPLLRVVRDGETAGDWLTAESVAEAARLACEQQGNIMLTTGSKDLATFVEAIPDFAQRVYARILPVKSSLEHALELGIPVDHIIAMQGPFSAELNRALIHDLDIEVMVSKASGITGGFPEKVEAAHECGIKLIVIHRPVEETGLTLPAVQHELVERFGV